MFSSQPEWNIDPALQWVVGGSRCSVLNINAPSEFPQPLFDSGNRGREEGAPAVTSALRNNLTVTPATTGGKCRPMRAEQPPVSTNHNTRATQADRATKHTENVNLNDTNTLLKLTFISVWILHCIVTVIVSAESCPGLC